MIRTQSRWMMLATMVPAIWGCAQQHPSYESLIRAIKDQDIVSVQNRLNGGQNPNTFYREEYFDEAPLCAAVETGNQAIVRLLMSRGANVNVTDGDGQNPLELASRNNDLKMMQFLVVHGATINDDGWGGSWSLETATGWGNTAAVKYLLAKGANPNTLVNGAPTVTLLYSARSSGQSAVAQILQRAGGKAYTVANPPWDRPR